MVEKTAKIRNVADHDRHTSYGLVEAGELLEVPAREVFEFCQQELDGGPLWEPGDADAEAANKPPARPKKQERRS